MNDLRWRGTSGRHDLRHRRHRISSKNVLLGCRQVFNQLNEIDGNHIEREKISRTVIWKLPESERFAPVDPKIVPWARRAHHLNHISETTVKMGGHSLLAGMFDETSNGGLVFDIGLIDVIVLVVVSVHVLVTPALQAQLEFNYQNIDANSAFTSALTHYNNIHHLSNTIEYLIAVSVACVLCRQAGQRRWFRSTVLTLPVALPAMVKLTSYVIRFVGLAIVLLGILIFMLFPASSVQQGTTTNILSHAAGPIYGTVVGHIHRFYCI